MLFSDKKNLEHSVKFKRNKWSNVREWAGTNIKFLSRWGLWVRRTPQKTSITLLVRIDFNKSIKIITKGVKMYIHTIEIELIFYTMYRYVTNVQETLWFFVPTIRLSRWSCFLFKDITPRRRHPVDITLRVLYYLYCIRFTSDMMILHYQYESSPLFNFKDTFKR